MSLEIVKFNILPQSNQLEVATLVSDFTNGRMGEQPAMLPMKAEDIFAKHTGSVAMRDGVFAGYVGALHPETHQGQPMSEIGSLWIPKGHRRHGIAHELVGDIRDDLVGEGIRPFAFCNDLSLKIFQQSGFVTQAIEAIPDSALSLCATCPLKPAAGCCDTVVVWNRTAA